MIVAVVFKPGRGIQNSGMSWAWIYLVFPWVGSIVAVIIYEFLFKKGQDAVKAGEEQTEDAENAEARLLQQEWEGRTNFDVKNKFDRSAWFVQ